MIAVSLIGITIVAILIFFMEWRAIPQNSLLERAAFLGMTCGGWLLAVIVIIAPELSSPSEWIASLYNGIKRLFV